MERVKNYVPHVVVFISSMGIMIVELVASRVVAKYFGNSLYTWTGIIGIVLGGISLGNYIGGRLADRFNPRRTASLLLLLASALTLLIILLDFLVGYILTISSFSTVTAAIVFRSVAVIAFLFFLPSTALGTISPVMAKYALEMSIRIGNTVGGIYAAGSAGSIVGTFLSGFVLVPLLGIRAVIFLVAGTIALLSLLLRSKNTLALAWVTIITMLYLLTITETSTNLFALSGGKDRILFETDSMYSHIKVEEDERERVLIMDGLIHNRYEPGNPDNLLYEYERVFKILTGYFLENRLEESEFTTLTLGGGALTFPYYLERHYPLSENEVVEIDPEVIRVAHRFFDIPENTGLTIIITDARNYVRSIRGKKHYDIVYLDVFDSFSIPYHLTTREFAQEIKDVLAPDGLLLVNSIDIFSIGKFLSAYSLTLEEVFPYVAVYSSANLNYDSRSTFVLVAGNEPFSLPLLFDPDSEVITANRIPESELREIQNRNGNIILTDDHAPVENLIAPVFLHSLD